MILLALTQKQTDGNRSAAKHKYLITVSACRFRSDNIQAFVHFTSINLFNKFLGVVVRHLSPAPVINSYCWTCFEFIRTYIFLAYFLSYERIIISFCFISVGVFVLRTFVSLWIVDTLYLRAFIHITILFEIKFSLEF